MSNGSGGLSPCDQGEEIDIAILRVREGQRMELRMLLCNSPFRVQVFRDQTMLFNQQNLRDEITVPVPGLTVGNHTLVWTFLASASPWKTRSEIFVDGNLEFRRREGGNSSNLSGRLSVLIQVTS